MTNRFCDKDATHWHAEEARHVIGKVVEHAVASFEERRRRDGMQVFDLFLKCGSLFVKKFAWIYFENKTKQSKKKRTNKTTKKKKNKQKKTQKNKQTNKQKKKKKKQKQPNDGLNKTRNLKPFI